jgi:hypothetical protein
VWDLVCLVENQFATWLYTVGELIKTDELLEEVRRLQLRRESKKPANGLCSMLLG